jgi:hypothetical protein
MARRQHGFAGLNLDSLMDTLTNVVGFLLILMAIMKLGVGEAVERIRLIDPEALGIREEDLQKAKKDVDSKALEMEWLLKRLKELESDLKILVVPTDLQAERKIELPKISPDTARKQLDEFKKKGAVLEKEFTTEDAESARLKALLARVPLPAGVPGKNVTLPDPRPAPRNSLPAYVLCIGGRVMPVDLAAMQKLAVGRITDSWGQMNLRWVEGGGLATTSGPQPTRKGRAKSKTPAQQKQQEILYDPAKVTAFFKQLQIGNYDYRLGIRTYDTSSSGNLEFTPVPNGGETVEQIKLPSSRYRAALAAFQKNNNYLRFMVNTNSFETYVEARGISDQYRLPAGWEMITTPTWLASLGPEVKFHQKIVPPPPPPAPPPPPGAKPPPPPNVLD